MLQVGGLAPQFNRQPVFGLPVDLDALCARRAVVLCFVRYLGSPFTRQALSALQAAYARFDVAGVSVVAITDSSLVIAQDFVPRNHMLMPLICDPDRELFESWQVDAEGAVEGTVRQIVTRRGTLREAARCLLHGHGRLEGRTWRLPAEFVVGPGRELLYVHHGRSILEQPLIDELLQASGAKV